MNLVILYGNLTRDPELRHLRNDNAVCRFGMAINRRYRGRDGVKESTTFVDLTAWGKTGESISKNARKGDPMLVQGRLELDEWEDKQTGARRSKLEVTVESVQFVFRPRDDRGDDRRRDDDRRGYGDLRRDDPPRDRDPERARDSADQDGGYGPDEILDDVPF